ncbi:Pentapeptide repeat-containing protein [Amycolatopsis arida]|uniref:Pentapeptide repeat-containing protein n=1 Tax=Amycolatopsis arida TaxID=587909 RepID=A0A1I5PKE7_9PSEU|nr:pentapeptide repeat-containing protein [Amycolatopsis arida]TDX98528.1 pentapeptide repeat protein [Amycolatopsis arida]SFP34525.1 Pentapeptide repeat-containing protein [Amycolatopsis arida]
MPERSRLRADCARCAALCCVAPTFAASADFAIDKPAGRPCPNLLADFRCGVHDGLRERGFPGCAVFDCFGAGQHVTQVTFGGRSWRDDPAVAGEMFRVFGVQRQLHELLWYLDEALDLVGDGALADELRAVRAETERLVAASPAELAEVDPAARRRQVGPLLARVSAAVRSAGGPDHTGADLVGARLRGADLRDAGLRGAYLLGADLRGADLRGADLLGADLRAADLRGTRLAGALFLTQPQLAAARGDAATTIPAALTRPEHWTGPASPATPAPPGTRRRSSRGGNPSRGRRPRRRS